MSDRERYRVIDNTNVPGFHVGQEVVFLPEMHSRDTLRWYEGDDGLQQCLFDDQVEKIA